MLPDIISHDYSKIGASLKKNANIIWSKTDNNI